MSARRLSWDGPAPADLYEHLGLDHGDEFDGVPGTTPPPGSIVLRMDTLTTTQDSLLGRYLSITGVVHTSRGCATRGRNKGSLITAEDVAYWVAQGTSHDVCERCSK